MTTTRETVRNASLPQTGAPGRRTLGERSAAGLACRRQDERFRLLDQIERLATLSKSEIGALQDELQATYGFSEIIGISPQLQELFKVMAEVARVDVTVLITGEPGTGKELVARAIHRRSKRASSPFVAVNCSAIPRALVESKLFGHVKGAFTDARKRRPGRFEQADGGTLFLDEVGDLALDAQPKVLRVLQDGEVVPVGGQRGIRTDVRVIAATSKAPEQLVAAGSFRQDLFRRLNVVHLELPPLRRRRGDLPLLLDHFLARCRRVLGVGIRTISPQARQRLIDYDWPGNVRELENTVCRAMVLCEGDTLTVADLPARLRGDPAAAEAPTAD
jgi:two-component system response regulator AtoC